MLKIFRNPNNIKVYKKYNIFPNLFGEFIKYDEINLNCNLDMILLDTHDEICNYYTK